MDFVIVLRATVVPPLGSSGAPAVDKAAFPLTAFERIDATSERLLDLCN
jgi:hypothetical protein